MSIGDYESQALALHTVEDLVYHLNSIRSDFLVTGNSVGGIVLLDPVTRQYAGCVEIRTNKITLIKDKA